jgi:hypothetical protein
MKKLAIIFAALGTMGLMACGPVQSDECAAYIACQEKLDEDNNTTVAEGLQDTYGETGSCWTTTAEAATACTDACVTAMESNATAYPEVTECEAA